MQRWPKVLTRHVANFNYLAILNALEAAGHPQGEKP